MEWGKIGIKLIYLAHLSHFSLFRRQWVLKTLRRVYPKLSQHGGIVLLLLQRGVRLGSGPKDLPRYTANVRNFNAKSYLFIFSHYFFDSMWCHLQQFPWVSIFSRISQFVSRAPKLQMVRQYRAEQLPAGDRTTLGHCVIGSLPDGLPATGSRQLPL